MKLMPWGVVLAGISLVSCQGRQQALSPDVAKQVDKIFEKWNRAGLAGLRPRRLQGRPHRLQARLRHGQPQRRRHHHPGDRLPRRLHVQAVHRRSPSSCLQQQGKLSLDDDVHKYIPELPDFGERITLRHMMHHTSGLRDQWSLLGLAGWRYSQDLITDDDVLSVARPPEGAQLQARRKIPVLATPASRCWPSSSSASAACRCASSPRRISSSRWA